MPRSIADLSYTETESLSFPKATTSSGQRIVHLGLGAFARAHIAVLTQKANAIADSGWRISGVVRSNQQLAKQLREQNYRYSVYEKSDSPSAMVVDVIDEVITWKSEYPNLVKRLCESSTKIITLTVTEKAYCLDNQGKLDLSHADIHSDLQGGEIAQSVIGLLAHVASRRMEEQGSGLIILSCDNLSKNGDTLKSALLAFCSQKSTELSQWVETNCEFPNTVVDCIVPKVGPEQVLEVQKAFDIDDQVPVLCEPFRQWVIASQTPLDLPLWELAGAELTTSIDLSEQLKLRILNAAHSVLAYAGLLQDCRWVHQAVRNDVVMDVLSEIMEEIVESFDERMAAKDYFDSVLKRFENPAMEHELSQIACDGSAKIVVRWLPSMCAKLDSGSKRSAFSAALASWLACWTRINNEEIAGVSDPAEKKLIALSNIHAQMHESNTLELSVLRAHWENLLGMTFTDTVLEDIHSLFINCCYPCH